MQHHKTEKITFRGRELVVNEITVAQVDEWEAALGQGGGVEPHKLDQLMGKSLPVSGLRLCVPDLTDKDLTVAPSEIAQVYDAVEKVNPFFLRYVENMARLGEALMAASKNQEKE